MQYRVQSVSDLIRRITKGMRNPDLCQWTTGGGTKMEEEVRALNDGDFVSSSGRVHLYSTCNMHACTPTTRRPGLLDSTRCAVKTRVGSHGARLTVPFPLAASSLWPFAFSLYRTSSARSSSSAFCDRDTNEGRMISHVIAVYFFAPLCV